MKRLIPLFLLAFSSCSLLSKIPTSTILDGVVNCLDDVIRKVAIPCERHIESALFEADWTSAVLKAGETCVDEAPQDAKDAGKDILESGFACAVASVASESASAAAISDDAHTDRKAERSQKFLEERWPGVEYRLE